MSIFVRQLFSGTGTGSQVNAYTVDANTTVVLKKLGFNNTTAGALLVSLSVNDGTADRQLLTTVSIAAQQPYNPQEWNGLTINAGGIVKITAPVGVVYWGSGLVVVQ